MPDAPNPRDLHHRLRDRGTRRTGPAANRHPGPEPRAIDLIAQSDLVRTLRPGDRLRLTFIDRPVNEDLAVRVLAFCVLATTRPGDERTLDMNEMSLLTLWAAVESGKWLGFRTYEATVLTGFDPDDLIYRLVRHGALESIEKLDPESSS